MGYQPAYEIKSAKNDIVDPVYENVDPVGVTAKLREAKLRGDLDTTQKAQSGAKKDAYFFTLGLTGSGCPIKGKNN